MQVKVKFFSFLTLMWGKGGYGLQKLKDFVESGGLKRSIRMCFYPIITVLIRFPFLDRQEIGFHKIIAVGTAQINRREYICSSSCF